MSKKRDYSKSPEKPNEENYDRKDSLSDGVRKRVFTSTRSSENDWSETTTPQPGTSTSNEPSHSFQPQNTSRTEYRTKLRGKVAIKSKVKLINSPPKYKSESYESRTSLHGASSTELVFSEPDTSAQIPPDSLPSYSSISPRGASCDSLGGASGGASPISNRLPYKSWAITCPLGSLGGKDQSDASWQGTKNPQTGSGLRCYRHTPDLQPCVTQPRRIVSPVPSDRPRRVGCKLTNRKMVGSDTGDIASNTSLPKCNSKCTENMQSCDSIGCFHSSSEMCLRCRLSCPRHCRKRCVAECKSHCIQHRVFEDAGTPCERILD